MLVAGGALALAATRGLAQRTDAPRRIAVLLPYSKNDFVPLFETFRTTLASLGQVEGRDMTMDVRWAENRQDRFPELVGELLAGKPDVIVTASSAGVRACMKATSTIPIVFATAFNPVEQKFVGSLRRPGGNVTGVLVYSDLTPKLAELAREVFPDKRNLAMLVDEKDPAHVFVLKMFESSAKRHKFEPQVVRVSRAEDFPIAFAELGRLKSDVVILPLLSLFTGNTKRLARQAFEARMPLLGSQSSIAEDGGLLRYGTLGEENYRRAALLVDKILRGAKPGDLPVEQPEKFQLTINMRTAKSIGVSLSPQILQRADRIIE